jgi:sucrose phosphorylase
MATMRSGPMLNAYPDSLGGSLSQAVRILSMPEFEGCFQSFYILPSLFHSDLDRGFSVVDYGLDESTTRQEDLEALKVLGIDLKLDFVLNHMSVKSPQFADILANGRTSRYADFFIDWNRFWSGHGMLTEAGFIQPDPDLLAGMFFRKPGLPLLMVRMPDGEEVPFWNTFYQEVRYLRPTPEELAEIPGMADAVAEAISRIVAEALDAGLAPKEIGFGPLAVHRAAVVEWLEARRTYLGQMDLDIRSPLVWEFYEDTLRTLADYGAGIVRLDAFAYAPKSPGAKNFLNDPETWDLLEQVRRIADRFGLELLPEIHARYSEGIHERITREGYAIYDFFLPGLLLDAFDRKDTSTLIQWIREIRSKGLRTVNMLGCHDGIPLLDLEGLLPIERIETLVRTLVARGGYVKDLHGQKNIYYQVNSTYYSALGESDDLLLLARAIQLFMPGKPQVWYLDLFAGSNDHEAVAKVGPGGHKEINRTNLDEASIRTSLDRPVVRKQLELLRFRNAFPAFGFDADLRVLDAAPGTLGLEWTKDGFRAILEADLATGGFRIHATGPDGCDAFSMQN